MTTTNNLQRKNRLSLNKGFYKKNQNDAEFSQHDHNAKSDQPPSPSRNKNDRTDRSPSLISFSSDNSTVENTPPRQGKLINFDDSFDYENNCFSPSLLMSQAVTIESPEIGWKWDCSSHNNKESITAIRMTTTTTTITTTPTVATRSDINNGICTPIRFKCNEMGRQLRMKQRKKLEQELHKERRLEIEKTLQERCAKLQQLVKLNNHINHNDNDQTICSEMLQTTHNNTTIIKNNCKSPANSVNYFDDSISDEILVAATQEVEAQLSLTQDIPCISTNNCKLPLTLTTVPSSSGDTKQKRSPFSSKFFGDHDDDDADDWIFQIDEDTLQNKSKTLLQRYKSLPINSHNNTNEDNKDNKNARRIERNLLKNEDETKYSLDNKKLKRHVSTNSLSTTASTTTIRTTTIKSKLPEKERSKNRLLLK